MFTLVASFVFALFMFIWVVWMTVSVASVVVVATGLFRRLRGAGRRRKDKPVSDREFLRAVGIRL